ncbi:hypothetical protein FRC07_001320 [Ceratobasidium sp. 392]|nr:hypothetical protein FRC07_001320 [Ceratobasidium sp. 392]
MGDLKPDPAESSARTLLVMSNMLAAIANGQNVTTSDPEYMELPEFSPSQTAIIVNVLWFLSLSLSVAVSLAAMLAKDWCYKFMSSRSGPAYEQARRRQKKWNGMERWKMKEVLTYMPVMMHLALLGLCVYLWDINVKVALPVVVVTSLAALVYICATVLPKMDPFCPYSTPAMVPFTHLKLVRQPLSKIAKRLNKSFGALAAVKLSDVMETVIFHSYYDKMLERVGDFDSRITRLIKVPTLILTMPAWLPAILFILSLRFFFWLPPLIASNHFVASFTKRLCADAKTVGPDDDDANQLKVSMDIITSQMLAWLVNNCEDFRSVDTALQAISGANASLPHEPLLECGALQLVLTRLKACLDQEDEIANATVYYRTCAALGTGAGIEGVKRWWLREGLARQDVTGYVRFQLDRRHLLEQAYSSPNYNFHAAVVAAAMPMFYWNLDHDSGECDYRDTVLRRAATILHRHLEADRSILITPVLGLLVESTGYCLAREAWLGGTTIAEQFSTLIILLAHVFFECYSALPDVAHSIASMLAAVAAPRPNHARFPPEAQQDQATELLQYHRRQQPSDKETTLGLFVFGFFELLPRLQLTHELFWATATPKHFSKIMQNAFKVDFSVGSRVHALPTTYSLMGNVYTPALDCLTSMADGKSFDNEKTLVYKCLPLLIHLHGHEPREPGFNLYVLALPALCHAKSTEFQNLCLAIMDAEPIPDDPVRMLKSFGDQNPLERLCGMLVKSNTEIAAIATLHFGLLVASVFLEHGRLQVESQVVLGALLTFRNMFSGLRGPDPLNREVLLSNLPRSANERSKHDNMQLIIQATIDFCEAGINDPLLEDQGRFEQARSDLQELKDGYKPSAAQVVRSTPVSEGVPTSPAEGAEGSNLKEVGAVRGPEIGWTIWNICACYWGISWIDWGCKSFSILLVRGLFMLIGERWSTPSWLHSVPHIVLFIDVTLSRAFRNEGRVLDESEMVM